MNTEAQVSRVTWDFDSLVTYLADKYDQDEDLARRIIKCESRNMANAKNDNYTKKGVYWSSDHGYWQVNDYYHQAAAKKKDLDIRVWEENLEYGFILLKNEGIKPWKASSKCWNKT